MNVYRCWYQGIRGYSCRIRDKRWMFVPDFDQPDKRTYRNLELGDLNFCNKYEQRFEHDYQASVTKSLVPGFLQYLTGRKKQSATVYGELLLP